MSHFSTSLNGGNAHLTAQPSRTLLDIFDGNHHVSLSLDGPTFRAVQTAINRHKPPVRDDADSELLEALKEGVDLIKGDLVGLEWKMACNDWMARARAAIAKAEGGQ